MDRIIRIGTRGSKLALWQAEFTQDKLRQAGYDSELVIIKTTGDNTQALNLSFDKIEGKGFFTKEIEDALLRGDVDMAVHSMKDMPTSSPDGLVLTAVSYREDPADWLLVRKESIEVGQLFQLKQNPVVGTSSARRKAQILDLRPDAQLKDIRGNVPTRVDKLMQGEFDAIMLAAAGLSRLELDLSGVEVIKFDPREFIPAPAQGVLAYQTCTEDKAMRKVLQHLHHAEVSTVTNVERRILQLMEGGCQMPLGVYCEQDKAGNFHVWAAKADAWNGPVKKVRMSSSTSYMLAEKVAEELKK